MQTYQEIKRYSLSVSNINPAAAANLDLPGQQCKEPSQNLKCWRVILEHQEAKQAERPETTGLVVNFTFSPGFGDCLKAVFCLHGAQSPDASPGQALQLNGLHIKTPWENGEGTEQAFCTPATQLQAQTHCAVQLKIWGLLVLTGVRSAFPISEECTKTTRLQ